MGGENSLRYFVSQLDECNSLNGRRANGTELGVGGSVCDRWNCIGSDCMKLLTNTKDNGWEVQDGESNICLVKG